MNKKSAPDEIFSITLMFGEKQMTITIKGNFTFRNICILLWSEYGKELQSIGMTKTTVVNACVFNFHFGDKLMNDHGRRSASAWGLLNIRSSSSPRWRKRRRNQRQSRHLPQAPRRRRRKRRGQRMTIISSCS